jgi:peptidoglycan-associated lipoprotein
MQADSLSTRQTEAEAPDTSVDESDQRRLEEERLRAEAAAREASRKSFLVENIHFAFDSSVLSDQARRALHDKADYLRTNPDVTVVVEGHCDERGTENYNIALGEKRAESVKKFLVDLGISTARMDTVSYGEEWPLALGQDEASWAKNRRAQFAIK